MKDKTGFATLIDKLAEHYIAQDVDLVLGMEARGFIFAPALAYRLNAGFVPVRKPGKLPAETVKYDYALEYGTNSLEIHKDAIQKGQRVLIVDDLLATGGTAEATAKLAVVAGRQDCRPGICGGTGIPEGPRQAQRIRSDVAAAVRQVRDWGFAVYLHARETIHTTPAHTLPLITTQSARPPIAPQLILPLRWERDSD